jgi:DNA-binding transcriptional MerR regulator
MTETVASSHLSIGEVLALVQADFPDVTISKIRFLESQGLIAPERTASGYRKFYDADIERLRWILAQQRDHFLPLKVIKKMLDQGVDVADPSQVQPSLFSSPDDAEADAPPQDAPERPTTPRSAAHPAVKSSPRAAAAAAAAEPEAEPEKRHATPADVVAALQEDPRSARGARKGRSPAAEAPVPDTTAPAAMAASRAGGLGTPAEGEPMTRDELCETTGITEELLTDLESYGLIAAAPHGGLPGYDAEAQMVARAAARYVELGVEPRHLRMYKVAAEREAGFVEQLVMPLLKQRNPSSREQAVDRTDELLALGAELHASLLRRQLGPVLGT